ncbi:sterol desaturase family protein [Parvularcula dongshanensis]
MILPLWLKITLVLGTAAGMEAVAWSAHKYIMHGWGWSWHRDHHEPHDGALEHNDLYAVVFGVFSTVLFVVGYYFWPPLWWIALGITLYGIMYAFVHDGLVHGRLPIAWVPKRGYFKRLVQAHKLHHATTSKHGAVSYGFVLAPDPKKLQAKLRALRAERKADMAAR